MTASGDTGPPTNTTAGVVGDCLPVGEHVGERGRARAVEHQAERTLVTVFEDEDHGAVEVRIDERWRLRRVGGRARAGVGSEPHRPAVSRPMSPSLLAVVHPRRVRAELLDDLASGRRRGARAHRCRSRRGLHDRLDRTLPGSHSGRRAAARRSTRSPVSCARATRRASRWCPRAATPASSAVRFRCAARSSFACAGSTRSVRSTRAPAQVTARRRRHARRGAGARARGRLGVRRRPRGPRQRDDRRHHRDQRGRCARTPLRHRPADQVVGVQAVLANGDVIERLDGLEKDNTGYDLSGLLCGSEGTLAVVTAARLAARPAARARRRRAARLRRRSTTRSMRSAALRRDVDGLQALEICEQVGLDLVCEQLGLRPPFAAPRTARTCWSRRPGASTPPTRWPRVVDALAGVGDVAVATDARASRSVVALPRGARRGDQPTRAAAQARCHARVRTPARVLRRACGRPSRPSRPVHASGCSGTRATATCT